MQMFFGSLKMIGEAEKRKGGRKLKVVPMALPLSVLDSQWKSAYSWLHKIHIKAI